MARLDTSGLPTQRRSKFALVSAASGLHVAGFKSASPSVILAEDPRSRACLREASVAASASDCARAAGLVMDRAQLRD